MCFKKKEEVIPIDAPIAEQARPYLTHKKSLNELDYENANHVKIAIYCLNANPTMARDLDLNNSKELAILKIWINNDYSNYLLCIKNKIDHIDLLTMYIVEKLLKTLESSNESVALLLSYDKRLLINYQYETKNGEAISYFDKNLGIPTSLVAKANLKLKLIDAQKLVESIDVALKLIDMSLVSSFIVGIINRILRDEILNFINSKGLSFYDLPQYYTEINDGVYEKLSKHFSECGLKLTDFSLYDVSVPNNTDKLLRDQYFAIYESERIKEHEYKMEKQALDLYERKAAIHSKYPDFPITLTEAEKDFALNRYLMRIGQNTSLTADIKDEVLEVRKVENKGTVTAERKIAAPAVPSIIKKSNKPRLIYGISVAAMYLIALICFSGGAVLGFSMLAVVTFIAGISAIVCFDKLKYGGNTEATENIGYRRESDMYINQQLETQIEKDSSNQDVSKE